MGADGVVTICERLILKKDGGVVLVKYSRPWHTIVSHDDQLEGLPPKISCLQLSPGRPTSPQGTTNLNSHDHETLSRVFFRRLTPTDSRALISRATCRPRSACAMAQALSALPVA